ncbi:MAG: hypothetical protein Q4B03_00720 [Lachnospiraceae bacterium]|nr:hypothetical protein [Lachnospiraceae bacterium]
MKRKKSSKQAAVLLLAGLMAGALSGCNGSDAAASSEAASAVGEEIAALSDINPSVQADRFSEGGRIKINLPEHTGEDADSDPETAPDSELIMEDVSYVMIYNPYFYDENNELLYPTDPANLNTGSFGSQISAGIYRGDELEEEEPLIGTIAQNIINEEFNAGDFSASESRGAGLDPVYEEGDTKEFYCGWTRVKKKFTCLYEGDSCYIWSLEDSITYEDAEEFGREFDNTIYPVDTEYFGTARFTENGGKIHLLFYPIEYSGSGKLLGYFAQSDLYTADEAGSYVDVYKMNTDHALIHINSDTLSDGREVVCSTMGHELQHLVCFSDCFYSEDIVIMDTWLNEAMSAYAEDLLYPGSKDREGYNTFFYKSDLYRNGQSLYNFSTRNDRHIGAYGAVYLFSEYLTEQAGDHVFSAVHSYWREAGSSANEMDAVIQAVPKEFYDRIDQSYGFSESVSADFANASEEWFSKMTLDFYLNTVKGDFANLGEDKANYNLLMQYREINPLDIEGGGKIIITPKNNQYAIPSDADENLIYIGLNEQYEPVAFYGLEG